MYKGLLFPIHPRSRLQDVTEVFLRGAVENSRSRLLQAAHFTLGRNPPGQNTPIQEHLVPHRDSPFGLLRGKGEVEVVLENEVLHTTIEYGAKFLRKKRGRPKTYKGLR